MQYLDINKIFFLELITILVFILVIWLRLRCLNNLAILSKKYLKLIKKADLPVFYSSTGIKKENIHKFFHIQPSKEAILTRVCLKNQTNSIKLIKNELKKKQNKNNYTLFLLYAKLNMLSNNRIDFEHTLELVKIPFYAKPIYKANYLYLKSLSNLHLTDMLQASKYCSKALKIYQKEHCEFEEAECYLALAQIYRISGVFDVAHTMLKEAKKIFSHLEIYAKEAETIAYLGLSELGQENYSSAISYFNDAKKICQNHQLLKTMADINNWLGLCYYLKNNIKTAENIFLSIKKANPQTEGFAQEMLARIKLKNNELLSSLAYTNNAIKSYKKANHISGIFESSYLKAEVLYKQNNFNEAKKILTLLIKQETPHSTIYYKANAYTLLGSIYLKEKNYELATTLFKQALDLEHSQNRIKGAIIDYNNLAEIARIKGDKTNTKKYLKLALEYAKNIDDKELITYLKSKL